MQRVWPSQRVWAACLVRAALRRRFVRLNRWRVKMQEEYHGWDELDAEQGQYKFAEVTGNKKETAHL
ncbi:hypothetical protein RMSM_06488 [Rhodopirellula maiorica SM1]|uniref:Uncharacterized protein n=1 Tax=Rhodopirellula maiorica SM1 TaxID=1265738 RepID=M5RBZ2_9BACT|nr:hypothetical protein RMSM_06488 [Rhodopirellula maiorica SM1]